MMKIFKNLFWEPNENFVYRSGFRRYNRSSVFFRFHGKIVEANFIIKNKECDLNIPGLTLKNISVKNLKFRRVIKNEILPPSQGYRAYYKKVKHYLYFVDIKIGTREKFLEELSNWEKSHKFTAIYHSDDSLTYGEQAVHSKK